MYCYPRHFDIVQVDSSLRVACEQLNQNTWELVVYHGRKRIGVDWDEKPIPLYEDTDLMAHGKKRSPLVSGQFTRLFITLKDGDIKACLSKTINRFRHGYPEISGDD